MEVSQPAAAVSSAQYAAEAEKGEEWESEYEGRIITGEKQETGGMEAVLAMLGEINSRMENLKARQYKLEQLCPKVEESDRIICSY